MPPSAFIKPSRSSSTVSGSKAALEIMALSMIVEHNDDSVSAFGIDVTST